MIKNVKKKVKIKDFLILGEQDNKIDDLSSQSTPLINENINQSPLSILYLFYILSTNKSSNNNENIEAILTEIIQKIDADTNVSIPTNSFEPLLFFLDKFSNYSLPIIYMTLRIIYMLITIPSQKKSEYFIFFSQPIFLDYYFNLFTIDDNSIRIITEIIRKKTQIFETYEKQISLQLFQSPPSEPLIDLLKRCFKIDPEFAPIDQISIKLDEILKLEIDECLFRPAAEFTRQIIKKYECVIPFFASNAIYYLKSSNDDVDNISLLKIYIEIVKITNDFSFLFINSNDTFINFLFSKLCSCHSKDSVIPTLFDLLSCEANISCFLNYPQILSISIQKNEIFPFHEQKKLMHFLSNFIINGNKKLLEMAVDVGIINFLSIFLDNCSDKRLTIKILKIIGLVIENQIVISDMFEIIQNIENFVECKDEEVANLALAVYKKINQTDAKNVIE